MTPLENPAKSLVPMEFHWMEVHWQKVLSLRFFSAFSSVTVVLASWMCSQACSAKSEFSLASKSQTLMPFSVPTAIQEVLGLKASPVTMAPASNSATGLEQSLKSQTLTFLSLPPVTMKVPLGEVVMALMFPSWALNESLISKDWLFQILSLPSQPVEAKKELAKLPLVVLLPRNLTLETQSEWLFVLEVNRQTPFTFHSLMVLSAPLDRICLLSEEKLQHSTSLVWPVNLSVLLPWERSHSRRDLSQLAESRWLLSLDRQMSLMKWEWPVRHFQGLANSVFSFGSLLNFQIMMVLSLEPEISTWVSSFSLMECPVAMLVTHPLWASRWPLSSSLTLCSTSVILNNHQYLINIQFLQIIPHKFNIFKQL